MKKLIALFVAILIISTGIAWFTSSRNKTLKEAVLPKEITVYSTVSNNEMQYIANEFKQQTGITVNYQIVSNLQQAFEENKGKVDFVYGGSAKELNSMASAGLLEKANFNFDGDISPLYKDSNGYWYGTSIEPIVMFYNHMYMLPKDAPKAWSDLTVEGNKGKVILTPDYSNYISNIMASMDAEHNSDANEMSGQQFENGLKTNEAVSTTNITDYTNNILKNKATPISFAPMNEVQALIQEGNPLTIVNPKNGSPLMVEGAAIVNGTKNLNAAKLFMEFVAGPKTQLQLATKFNVIPVSNNALKFAPSWMKSFNNINIAENDWNLLNDGQFEAYNKNNPQVNDNKDKTDNKNQTKDKAKEDNKNANAKNPAEDPLSQPNGSIVNLKPNAPLTSVEKQEQDALNQLQQQPSKVFTMT